MIKKKGLSTVVTTLIIILLVLVAIGIVWVVIANLVQEGSEQIFLDKFTTDLKIKDVLNVDNVTNSLDIDIKRNAGKGDLIGIKFIFNDGYNSEVIENLTTIDELGEKRFHFILSVLNIGDVQTISIAPLYKSSEGKTITGGIIASYRIGGGTGSVGSCVANCTGKICGSDGCGGSCNPGCGTNEYCSADQTQCLTGTCDLTTAVWSTTSAVEGTSVSLNLQGDYCNGKNVSFVVWEDDTLSGDDPVTTNPVNIIFSGASSSGTWVAEWQDDGIDGDPEYYFIASVVGESETITSSTATIDELTVTEIPTQTCVAQGGDICVGGETCSGSTIPASDSSRCCDVTCTAPVNSQVYREFSSSTVAPGGQIDVDLYVHVDTALDWFFVVYENVSELTGWTVVNDGGGNLGSDPNLGWTVVSSLGPLNSDYQITYTMQAPSTTGQYNFVGNYIFSNSTAPEGVPTLGDITVTVA